MSLHEPRDLSSVLYGVVYVHFVTLVQGGHCTCVTPAVTLTTVPWAPAHPATYTIPWGIEGYLSHTKAM